MTGAKAWWRLVGGEGAVCRLPQGEEGLSFLETVGAGEAAKKTQLCWFLGRAQCHPGMRLEASDSF